MIESLLRLLAPHSCCGCGNVGSLLCPQCKYDIVSEPFDRCISCLTPTASAALCSSCVRSSSFDGFWCGGERSDALRVLLDRYKFDSVREGSLHCADILASALPVLPSDTVIVPVPTSPAHRRSRGFDHTARIAKRIAQLRQMAYAEPLRRDGALTQHFLSKQDRSKVASQLRIVAGAAPRILLIDDIYTTGATMTACAKLLRSTGCQTLYGSVVARQVLDENPHL